MTPTLTAEERELLIAYRRHPETHRAIDTLLGIDKRECHTLNRNLLREKRTGAGLSREELSSISGVDVATINGIESDTIASVSTKAMKALATALNSTISELFQVWNITA